MNVKVLKPVNHKGRTVKEGEVIELDDITAKKLIEIKVVEEVKETKMTVNKTLGDTNA